MGVHQQIEYPLNDIKDLIQNDTTNCNNTRKPNHSNIEITYEITDDDAFTVYRCPVCLCIPIINYDLRKIEYKCNCGIHNCSIDYFVTNFKSHPISKIIFKDNSHNNDKMVYCSSCSKFINDVINHKKEYYGHIIRNIDWIFFKSEEGNYTEFKYYKYIIDVEGINQVSKKEEDNETNKIIKFKYLISEFLNYNIIKKIESAYQKCLKKYKKKNDKSLKFMNNQDLEFRLNMNNKLYIYLKYIYYCFEKNYSKQNLNMQIIMNLINAINQIKNSKYNLIILDLFLKDMSRTFYDNKNHKDLLVFFHGTKGYYRCFGDFQLSKAIYDKNTQRKILSISRRIYITQKK